MIITPARVNLPLRDVRDHAFMRFYSLTHAEFENAERIGDLAFAWCESLEHAQFGTVRYVSAAAFLKCPMRFRNATLRREVTP